MNSFMALCLEKYTNMWPLNLRKLAVDCDIGRWWGNDVRARNRD